MYYKNKYEMFSLTHAAVINPTYGHRSKKKLANIKVFIYFFILFIQIIKTTIFLQFYQKLKFKNQDLNQDLNQSNFQHKHIANQTPFTLFVSILPFVYFSLIHHFLSFIYLSHTFTLFVLRDTILLLVDWGISSE